MRKMLVLLVIAAVSGNAVAEWVAIGVNDFQTLYVDRSTILRAGTTVKMWGLHDLKSPQRARGSKPFLSTAIYTEYNCANRLERDVSSVFYADSLGKGAVIHSDSDMTKWASISPNTASDSAWQVACGLR